MSSVITAYLQQKFCSAFAPFATLSMNQFCFLTRDNRFGVGLYFQNLLCSMWNAYAHSLHTHKTSQSHFWHCILHYCHKASLATASPSRIKIFLQFVHDRRINKSWSNPLVCAINSNNYPYSSFYFSLTIPAPFLTLHAPIRTFCLTCCYLHGWYRWSGGGADRSSTTGPGSGIITEWVP